VRAALLAPLTLLLSLLGVAFAAAPQPALLIGLVAAVAVLALATAHRTVPAAAHTGAVAVRARRRALDQGPPPRQHDPDAAGHTRSRAPGRTAATV
jgi:protein-S-isoprenylcysteine O-methyltransferase Ste14